MTQLAHNLSLRPFRLTDADAIEPWLSAPGLSLPGGAARRDWPLRILADQRIVLKVAETRGCRVGLVRLDCGPDRIAEITLVVAPESRRCGHGRAMLEAAVVHARSLGLRLLCASIDLGNVTACEFFQDMGFVNDGLVGSRLRLVRPVHAGLGQPPLVIDV
ncbi:MAG: GNAT family N-acetyltransferase [Planctomycetes bacterium]|nr:GNAT family N-acetyltransferase [Planctomycetota bacterium]